jgi:hypothetical protein
MNLMILPEGEREISLANDGVLFDVAIETASVFMAHFFARFYALSSFASLAVIRE